MSPRGRHRDPNSYCESLRTFVQEYPSFPPHCLHCPDRPACCGFSRSSFPQLQTTSRCVIPRTSICGESPKRFWTSEKPFKRVYPPCRFKTIPSHETYALPVAFRPGHVAEHSTISHNRFRADPTSILRTIFSTGSFANWVIAGCWQLRPAFGMIADE